MVLEPGNLVVETAHVLLIDADGDTIFNVDTDATGAIPPQTEAGTSPYTLVIQKLTHYTYRGTIATNDDVALRIMLPKNPYPGTGGRQNV